MWKPLFSVLVACSVAVRAQNALDALAEHLPQCSLDCFNQELPESTCATNLTAECLCTSDTLNLAVAACAQQTCTLHELLETKNVTSSGCRVPVRRHGKSFVPTAFAGVSIALAAFVFRMMASLGKHGLVRNGLGRDIWTLEPEQITNVLYYYYLGEIFYVAALGISKISILFFYLRVFPLQSFRTATFSVMGLSVAYTIAFFLVTTFQCRPLSYAWTQWDGLHKGSCNNIHLQGWIVAAVSILLDAMIMALPMKRLASLNLNLKKKLMVMSMFSVGIFVIVVSIIRLYSLIHFANTENITWNYVDAGLWSLIEIDVSIVCGCMPAFRFLIGKLWPKIRSTIDVSSRSTRTKLSRTPDPDDILATKNDKTTWVSISSMVRDDDDTYIPLDDIDNNSDKAMLCGDKRTARESTTCIAAHTHTVELDYSDRPPTEHGAVKNSQDGPLGQRMTGTEHI
ncbi:hypothetical protein ACEQ8H_001439 [Pleosporales sp. CAS-2024a]